MKVGLHHTPAALALGKDPWYSLHRILGACQMYHERAKNQTLIPWLSGPYLVVTMATELLELLY
jgi:hypothetical protein